MLAGRDKSNETVQLIMEDSIEGMEATNGKQIGYLIKDEDRVDIEHFITSFPNVVNEYIPVSIIGEGTFSTVYKAIDVDHYRKDNFTWLNNSRQDPYDAARLLALYTSLITPVSTRARKRVVNSLLHQCIKDFVQKNYPEADDIEALQKTFEERPPIFVAIKRINATSGPKRIADELGFLRDLRGNHHVVPVITAIRHEDQVIVVSPYFYGLDFRDLLISLKIKDVAGYMRILLEALAHVHSNLIIHRDIKPSNFMFARESTGNGGYRGLLVDFGLAQYEELDVAKRAKTAGRRNETFCPDHLKGAPLAGQIRDLPPGYIQNDPRAQMKASRAGTRGFRAPEVLFKVAHQTIGIDVWSVGVILLTLLTKRYPFFQSTDDSDALVELASIFGHDNMSRVAKLYDRVWRCNIPTIPQHHVTWKALCIKLNPSGVIGNIPAECYDLLDKLLELDYQKRITALAALDHPFLTNF